MVDSEQRDRLMSGIYLSEDKNDNIGRIEHAFKLVIKAGAVENKIKKAVKTRALPKKRIPDLLDLALEKNIIQLDEYKLIKEAEEARWDAIQVDSFTPEEYWKNHKIHSFRGTQKVANLE